MEQRVKEGSCYVEVYGSVSFMIITLRLISSLIDSPFAIPTRCTYFVKCALLQFG